MTVEEVKQWFFREGLPVNEWARAHGFPPETVYALLAGRTVGRRGQAHRVAVALGLKGGSVKAKNYSAATSSPTQSEGIEQEGIML